MRKALTDALRIDNNSTDMEIVDAARDAMNEIVRLKSQLPVADMFIGDGKMASIVPTEYLDELRADNAALRSVVAKHEWLPFPNTMFLVCPECRQYMLQGHAPGCEIARLLKKEKPCEP
jgi:hypothetical protein